MRELALSASQEELVVSALHETGLSKFHSEARLRTALVQPETAAALVRALQSIDNLYRYSIPSDEEDRLEFDEPPYRLFGVVK